MNILKEVLEREYLGELVLNNSILFGNINYLKDCLDDYFALIPLNDWVFTGLGFTNICEFDENVVLINKGELKSLIEVGSTKLNLDDIYLNFGKQCTKEELPQYIELFNKLGFKINLDKMSDKVLNEYDNDEVSLFIGLLFDNDDLTKDFDNADLTIETKSSTDFKKYLVTI